MLAGLVMAGSGLRIALARPLEAGTCRGRTLAAPAGGRRRAEPAAATARGRTEGRAHRRQHRVLGVEPDLPCRRRRGRAGRAHPLPRRAARLGHLPVRRRRLEAHALRHRPASAAVQDARQGPEGRAHHRCGRRQRGARVAVLRRRAHRRGRAQPRHLRPRHRRDGGLLGSSGGEPEGQLRERRRPFVPRAQATESTTSSGTRHPTATRPPTTPAPVRSCCRRATCTRASRSRRASST